MIDIDWREAGAILTVSTIITGIVVWMLQAKLRDYFANRDDVVSLGVRIGRLEETVRSAPTHADLRAVGERMSAVEHRLVLVEREVAVASEGVRGMRDSLARVEAGVTMLQNHLLRSGE